MKIKEMLCKQCGKESHDGDPFTFDIGTYEGSIAVDKHGNIICNNGGNINTLEDLIQYINDHKDDERYSNRPQFLFSCFCIEDEVFAKSIEFEDGTIIDNPLTGEEAFRKAFMEN